MTPDPVGPPITGRYTETPKRFDSNIDRYTHTTATVLACLHKHPHIHTKALGGVEESDHVILQLSVKSSRHNPKLTNFLVFARPPILEVPLLTPPPQRQWSLHSAGLICASEQHRHYTGDRHQVLRTLLHLSCAKRSHRHQPLQRAAGILCRRYRGTSTAVL